MEEMSLSSPGSEIVFSDEESNSSNLPPSETSSKITLPIVPTKNVGSGRRKPRVISAEPEDDEDGYVKWESTSGSKKGVGKAVKKSLLPWELEEEEEEEIDFEEEEEEEEMVEEEEEEEVEEEQQREEEEEEEEKQSLLSEFDQDESGTNTPIDTTTTTHSQMERMTRRQRARYLDEREDGSMQELTTEPKKRKMTTEELALRRSEISRRRELQRKQRLEQSQRETIHKLLNKQATRKRKLEETENSTPPVSEYRGISCRYLSNKEGSYLIIPPQHPFYQSRRIENYPIPKTCAVPNCGNIASFVHSKLLKPACSLAHYKSLELI